MQRRTFVRMVGVGAGGFVLGFPQLKLYAEQQQSDLALVRDGAPADMVRKAVELLGGMARFVREGQTVLVKPNMGWDRAPEYAANTNPELAAEVVKLCYEAGAGRVISFDRTCNNARRCYINSGLEESMSDAGAKVRFMRDSLYETVDITDGFKLDKWEFYRDALEADVIINVPVLKHHSLARLTMGLKNTMGLIGGNRGTIHWSFSEKLVDLNRVIRPQLTIIDAVRVLRKNGPSGGNLKDVDRLDMVLAGVDPVLVDAWGAKIFGHDPADIEYIAKAETAGLGTADAAAYPPLEYRFVN